MELIILQKAVEGGVSSGTVANPNVKLVPECHLFIIYVKLNLLIF